MPASYTHFLVAREGLKRLSKSLQAIATQHPTLYYFGAQGADFCFFQPTIYRKEQNLGSFLHREGGFPAFETLLDFSRWEERALAYALGYVTHYATDSTFHPYVYATAGNSTLRHTRLEHVLDVRFKKEYGIAVEDEAFLKKPNREEKELLFSIYTEIATSNRQSAPKKSDFLRAISLFNAHLAIPYTLFDGASAKFRSFIANEEKRAWSYPSAQNIIRRDSAEELLAKSIRLAFSLCERFFESVSIGAPLPKSLFGKGFLTGI